MIEQDKFTNRYVTSKRKENDFLSVDVEQEQNRICSAPIKDRTHYSVFIDRSREKKLLHHVETPKAPNLQ